MALSGPRLGTARIAILTITDEEFAAARAVFHAETSVVGSPYFVEALSPERAYDVVLRRMDRTNHPSRDAVGRLVEDFRPEVFLLVGTAGGIHGRDQVLLGDVVIADYIEYCEFWKLLPERHAPRRLVHDQPSEFLRETFAEPLRHTRTWLPVSAARPAQEIATLVRLPPEGGWTKRAWSRLTAATSGARVSTSDAGSKVVVGNVVSGEKIWGDPTSEEQVRVLRYYDKAVALEMEAVGVARGVMSARTGVGYNPLYLVIRGISDLVNCEGNDQMRRAWTAYAAAAAAAFAGRLAQDYLAVPRVT